MNWTTDQVANIINLLAATATVWALVYAYILERRNSDKINDLAEITRELSAQNKLIAEQVEIQKKQMVLSVKPELVSYGASIRGQGLMLYIRNEGERATVQKIDIRSHDFTLHQIDLPFPIAKEGQRTLDLLAETNRPLEECEWKLIIHFRDALLNPYIFFMKGIGTKITKSGSSIGDMLDPRMMEEE